MKPLNIVLITALAALFAPGWSEAMEIKQSYIVVKSSDGRKFLEKAWVVDKRIIMTSPRELDAYVLQEDGIFVDGKIPVKFLARNSRRWIKVYVSDRDIPTSYGIPHEIASAYARLYTEIRRAGGLERFRNGHRRPDSDRYRYPVVKAWLEMDILLGPAKTSEPKI